MYDASIMYKTINLNYSSGSYFNLLIINTLDASITIGYFMFFFLSWIL